MSLAACALLSAVLAGCGPISQASPNKAYFPVIHELPPSGTPTPGPLTLTLGAWPSNSTPPANGQVTIFVSFRNVGAPVAGGKVTVTVQYPGRWRTFGPVRTHGNGLADIIVPVGGRLAITSGHGEQTIQVDAQVTYQGQTYRASTNFVPLP